MKKFLLLLFVPISLFSQFENDYYVINQDGFNVLKYYNILTNEVYSEIELNFAPLENGEDNPYNGAMIHSLTYSPITRNMFLIGTDYTFKTMGGSYQYVQQINKESGECFYMFTAGEDDYFGEDSSASYGLNINNLGKFVYLSYYHDGFGPINRNIVLTDGTIEGSETFHIDELNEGLGQGYVREAMAYNPQNGLHYFMVYSSTQSQHILYSFNTQTSEIEAFLVNLGNYQNINITAMTYSTVQNKILIADYNSENIFTLDLQGGNLELYIETNLQRITGLVSVHDLLKNIEVDNQGEIKIYPNPVKENLHIETNSKIERIELFNIVGQKLEEFNSNDKVFNLSNKSKGIYIIKIQLENGKIETKKIIKN